MRKTIILFFCLIVLAACSNNTAANTEDMSAASKEVKEEVTEETSEIKQHLLKELEAIKEDSELAREAKGYIEKDDFIKIKKEFHRLAIAAYSKAVIEFNDTQEIDDKIAMLETDIQQLSNEELTSVEDRYYSGKVLYKAMIQEDLQSVISGLDLSNSYNDLRAFLLLSEDATESEIYSMANDYSENLQEYEINMLNAIQEIVSENASAFTEEELSSLNEGLQHLIHAAETQIKVLSQFKEFYIDDSSNITDLVDEAKKEFDAGSRKFSEIEVSFNLN